jgi:hypothetical protein
VTPPLTSRSIRAQGIGMKITVPVALLGAFA